MDVSTGVAPPAAVVQAPLNTTFTGQNTIYVNNLNERTWTFHSMTVKLSLYILPL